VGKFDKKVLRAGQSKGELDIVTIGRTGRSETGEEKRRHG
jgi:hypothetical protein